MRSTCLFASVFAPICLVAQSLTVLSYNIRYANGHDRKNAWDFRKEAVANVVMQHRPTIIGLQEVLHDQLLFLKDQWPGYDHFGVGRDDGRESGEYAPVFFDTTAFQLLEGRTVWLSPTPDVPSMGWDATCKRIVTLVHLLDRIKGDSLWVANTHWDAAGKEARLQSARLLVDLLAGPGVRGKRSIFMGDLNARLKSPPIDFLQQNMIDACPKGRSSRGTFNGFKRLPLFSKRIDWVWLSDHWRVDDYEVPRPKVKCRQVSDHFPVIVRLSAR